MPRKTFEINKLKELVNTRLAGLSSISERQALSALLETILHAAGAYKGFNYLHRHHVPEGCEPGIIWDDENNRAISYPDDTRRIYF